MSNPANLVLILSWSWSEFLLYITAYIIPCDLRVGDLCQFYMSWADLLVIMKMTDKSFHDDAAPTVGVCWDVSTEIQRKLEHLHSRISSDSCAVENWPRVHISTGSIFNMTPVYLYHVYTSTSPVITVQLCTWYTSSNHGLVVPEKGTWV